MNSDNCIKQKRLPDNLQNLAEKSTFNSRLNLIPGIEFQSEMYSCCILTFMFVYCLQLTIRSVRDQLGKGIIYLVNNLFEVTTKDTEY